MHHEITEKYRTKAVNDKFNGTDRSQDVIDECQKASGAYHSKQRPKLLVWSSADKNGLARLEKVYTKHFSELSLEPGEANLDLERLAYTLGSRRSSLPWKSFVVANSIYGLQRQGLSFSQPVRSSKNLGIGYIFTDQGAQFNEMGKELLAYPVFKKKTLQKADMYSGDLGCEWSILGTTPSRAS